jgi:hypothetical protein
LWIKAEINFLAATNASKLTVDSATSFGRNGRATPYIDLPLEDWHSSNIISQLSVSNAWFGAHVGTMIGNCTPISGGLMAMLRAQV